MARRVAAQERGEDTTSSGWPTVRRIPGRDPGHVGLVHRGPAQAAAVLTAVYFDTLTRWLTQACAPFDLPSALAAKLDLVLAGLAAR